MLEVKTYTKPELTEMLGTKAVQGLKKKLERYHVDYEVTGKGENALFTISKIHDPFKVFCIIELGFDANTNFKALAYFYYYYFNDEEFMAMPDEVKMFRMESFGKYVSRQTIAKYISKLVQAELVYLDTAEFIYYFAYHDKQFLTERPVYCEAWKMYWEIKEEIDAQTAMNVVRHTYGGSPRKQAIPQINAFYLEKINQLLELVNQVVDADNDNSI